MADLLQISTKIVIFEKIGIPSEKNLSFLMEEMTLAAKIILEEMTLAAKIILKGIISPKHVSKQNSEFCGKKHQLFLPYEKKNI